MSETLSQIIAKMGTPAKPTGSTPKVPKDPKVPKVVQKARQTAVKRSPNPFVQAVEQAFKPTTPTKPQEPNLGQIIKQFKDVASSGRKQRGETLMQEYIRNTQPVSGNMGFKAGSGKGATIEAEMAAYDRKTFGAETYGKRPKGVSTAEWSKRQSHKGKFKQLAGTRNEQVAELDREIEAYKLENMTPVQRLELARETAGGLPGFYDKERASALAASLMGSQDLKDKTDASLFIRAANQVMQPVSTAYTVAMKDPRSLAEMPVGLQVGLSAGDLGAQIVGGFLTGGGSTPATASTLARIGAVATRSLALDAPGYIQMIEDAGGVDKALVAYKDMIGKALDPNSKISASERVNGIALAGMIVLSGGGKIAGKGPHADPNITTRLIETEAVPGSASDLRGQVGGVGLDAEPALRPGVAEPVAGVEPEKDSRLKDLVEGFDIETEAVPGSASDLRGQVGGVGLDAEPARRSVGVAEPDAKSRKGVQEPWQKTLEQLRRGNSRVAKPGTPRYYESQPDYDLSKLIRSGDRMAIIEASKRSMERGFRSPGEWENAIQREADALRETHRDAIVKALAEGKPVPPEVLADYPGLMPKAPEPVPPVPVAEVPAKAEPVPQEPVRPTSKKKAEAERMVRGESREARALDLIAKAEAGDIQGVALRVTPDDPLANEAWDRAVGQSGGGFVGHLIEPRSAFRQPWHTYVLDEVRSGKLTADEAARILTAASGDGARSPDYRVFLDELPELERQGREKRIKNAWYEENAPQYADSKGLIGRDGIQKALAEGKPVPPEVLADYPLLKPAERVEMEALKGQSGATADSVEPAGTSSRDGEPEMPATGLARQFTDPERFARELEETRAPAQSVLKLVDATQAEWGDGGHVKAELALRRGNEPDFNPTREQIVKDTAMVAHLKREVKNEYDRLLRKDDPTPQDMADIQAVVAKLNEIDEYAQKIRTHWHDLGMALQIAYKPDFTVADLTMRARAANGGDISPDAQKQINDWVSKYEAAQKELEELRKAKPPKEVSGVAVSRPKLARATAFNRLANLGLEVRGEDGALVAPTKGGGMKGGKQAGAVAIPKLTPSMENELRKSIRQIAKAYIVDEHPIAGSLDGVVTLVRKHLPSLSEEDILRYLSDRYHRVLLDSDLQRRESQAFMRRIQAAADYRNKTLLEKGFAQAGALLNTTQRGLQASMDLSAPFRQGRRVMVTKEWVNAWLPSTKAMFAKDPQKAMELHSAELARSPYYSKGVESGLGISSASKPEEVWAGRLLQDWAAGKGLAAGKANPLRVYANLIQRSEAHYTIFLNDLRMRLFENLAKRNPNDKEYLESIAQMINVMTGRGHGKTATMLSHPAAGNVFYAPRYTWSEVQSTGMVPIWKTKSKMARQEAIKAYGRNFAVTVVGLSLARLFGNEVELDPRATDFLKVRLQNGKVVDVLGASQQYLRLLVRMGYGSTSRKGFYSEPGAFGADPLMQAVNNKLSPAARSLLGLLRGWASPNADGDWEKQPAGMILRDAVTPMGARKTGDQMWSDGDKWALLNLLGIDYEKGQPNKRQKKGSRPPKLEGLPQGMRQFAGHAPITGR